MPVKSCNENGMPGFKFGDAGKCYTFKADDEKAKGMAKKKAMVQGIAMGEKVSEDEKLEMIAFDFANSFLHQHLIRNYLGNN